MNTPETDALIPQFLAGGEIPDILNFCRKMERERDEARRQCSQWFQEWHLTDKVRRDTKAERDEAREEVRKLKIILDMIKSESNV